MDEGLHVRRERTGGTKGERDDKIIMKGPTDRLTD